MSKLTARGGREIRHWCPFPAPTLRTQFGAHIALLAATAFGTGWTMSKTHGSLARAGLNRENIYRLWKVDVCKPWRVWSALSWRTLRRNLPGPLSFGLWSKARSVGWNTTAIT